MHDTFFDNNYGKFIKQIDHGPVGEVTNTNNLIAET